MTIKTVLVTGITGFIGSHTAILLLNKGYKVRGTMRNLKRADDIRAVISKYAAVDNLELVQAELTNPEDWLAAVEGMDYVQHIASPLPRKLPKDDSKLIIPAREGVLNVLKAASKFGVKRVVLTSSVAAISYGYKEKNRLYTEENWTDPTAKKYTNAYNRSKTIAERAAWEFMDVNDVNTELAVINPVAVLGPVLEKDYGTSALLIKKLMSGEFPGLPNLGFSIVDVRDVAELHILAMTAPEAAGKRFISNSEFVWLKDIAKMLKSYYPDYAKKIPSVNFPNFLVKIFSLFDGETKAVVNELGAKRQYDYSQARDLLGWSPRSAEEAIKAMADSLIAQKIV